MLRCDLLGLTGTVIASLQGCQGTMVLRSKKPPVPQRRGQNIRPDFESFGQPFATHTFVAPFQLHS